MNAAWQTSVTYPDNGCVTCSYDFLGRKTSLTDQNGTVHQYTFDSAGRFKMDAVTTPGTGVDTAVRAITRAYDAVGRTVDVTSWANANGTTPVNDVAVAYDGWSRVVGSQQEHVGAVGGSTPAVGYAYDDGNSGGSVAQYSRLTEVVYPSGGTVWYNYPGSNTVGGALSRSGSISADSAGSTVYEGYTYLGAGTVVQVAHPQVSGGLVLSYVTGSGSYGGFDQFGRVVDQAWTKDNGSTLDNFTYGYDGNSNRLWRHNVLAATQSPAVALDEAYAYDNLNRLVNFQVGTLNSNNPPTITSPATANGYGLDFLGNWANFSVSAGGNAFLNQSRTVNSANEITGITTATGPAWVTPSYDAAGNMTAMPRPGAETTGLTSGYDAWNRQVSVSGSAGLIANYVFDGLNHRIAKGVKNGTNWNRTDYYYNQSWQTVEERQSISQTSSISPATAVYCVYVWDLRYIDAPVCRLRSNGGTLNETLFYCNDANFHTTAVVSLAGAVFERYSYDAYGKPTFYDGSWNKINGSAYDNQILFTGQRYDPETGYYYFKRREYNPSLGLFTTVDTIGYPDGMNYYEAYFVPIGMDPFGLNWLTSFFTSSQSEADKKDAAQAAQNASQLPPATPADPNSPPSRHPDPVGPGGIPSNLPTGLGSQDQPPPLTPAQSAVQATNACIIRCIMAHKRELASSFTVWEVATTVQVSVLADVTIHPSSPSRPLSPGLGVWTFASKRISVPVCNILYLSESVYISGLMCACACDCKRDPKSH